MKNGLVAICIFGMVAVVACLGCEKNDPWPKNKEDPSTNYPDTITGTDVSKNVDANYDLPFVANIMDECPEKKCKIGNCKEGGAFAAMGFTSTCTKPCLGEEYGSEDLEDSDLDNILCGDFTTEKCCGNISSEGEEASYWCLPEGKCCRPPKPVVCGDGCCMAEETCNQETKICEPKCQPPAPLYCKNECCPNNYSCECLDNGGFCLPEGAEMCDCADKSWCEPLQECIQDNGCHEKLVSESNPPCKPLGAEDCPEADECYCNPGLICTHESPACCASDEPVPCGDYCCPDKNECLTDIKDCLPPGWDYCEQWGTKCGVGLDCKELESGCKDDDEEECGYGGIICSATENCVGEGKGIDGCCPTNQEVPCDGYCCPSGTHCEFGCSGCVEDGKKCCPDGQTQCLDAKICWVGGAECLDAIEQDCGSYICDPSYVCSSGPQQCCPASTPQTCGDQCCLSSPAESCVSGICIPSGGEYCPGATNNYCGIGNSCGKDWTQPCCCGNKCMPPGGTCCNANQSIFCDAAQDCCGSTEKGWLCIPANDDCCDDVGSGKHCFCPAGLKCCPACKSFSSNAGKYTCNTFDEATVYCVPAEYICCDPFVTLTGLGVSSCPQNQTCWINAGLLGILNGNKCCDTNGENCGGGTPKSETLQCSQ